MIAEQASTNIDTIEELSLFSLDQSQRGIDTLLEETAACGAALASDKARAGLDHLSRLVEDLHAFDLFENDLCSLFNLDRETFGDSKGSLESNAALFRETLNNISTTLEQNDMQSLGRLLNNQLSESLLRFKELLPLLRNHIDKEYVQAEDKK